MGPWTKSASTSSRTARPTWCPKRYSSRTSCPRRAQARSTARGSAMLTQTDKAKDLAGRFGGEVGGEFTPSGIPISGIAGDYGTPFYLYHGEMISDRVSRVQESL